MPTLKLKVNAQFTRAVLGSLPSNDAVLFNYLADGAPDENISEEAKAIREQREKFPEIDKEMQTTIFAGDEKGLHLWDYQVKGFIKEAFGVLVDLGDITGLTKYAYKRVCDSAIFIDTRKIYLMRDGKHIMKPDSYLERPLRAETMQGDRVALARSMQVNEGADIEFVIRALVSSNTKAKGFNAVNEENIVKALEYGASKGLLQWRNAGYGSFAHMYEVIKG